MSEDIDEILKEWMQRVDLKGKEVIKEFDQALLKAAIFCEGEAKKNAMTVMYNTTIPFNDANEDMWTRTGLLKAAIGSKLDENNLHTALVYCSAPYAKYIEYGTGIYAVNGDGRKTPWIFESNTGVKIWTRGMRAKPFMNPSVFQHKEDVLTIIEKHLKEVV